MNRTRPQMLRPAALLLLMGACLCLGGCVKLISAPLLLPPSELKPADAIVVLGFGPPVDAAGQPAPELRRRVDKAVELYRAGLAPVMIMTGGNTYKDFYESAVMKAYAVSLGVPAEAVIEERQAMDTIGNARYTARIMREKGLKRCLLVTSPFHLKRGKKLFEAAGVEVEPVAYDAPLSAREAILFSLYEYWVRVDYLFIDEEARARGDD